MTFFESLLVLLAIAILLLQVSRRLSIPYPAMPAAVGVGTGAARKSCGRAGFQMIR